ncbi:hypothetical protein [Georgenia wangjunii]|uniref:hypothetical protein n=1 Tax=Georgenia wangjunii TaxID=3117730 RepID=UPI002F26D497
MTAAADALAAEGITGVEASGLAPHVITVADEDPDTGSPPARLAKDGRWRRDVIAEARRRLARERRPAWCGTCDEQTRQFEDDDGRPARCPACHPLAAGESEPGVAA